MVDQVKKIMEYISLPWKIIISVGVAAGLFVSLFTIDNRFAKSDELVVLEKNIIKEQESAFKLAEAQTIKTFQTFQMQQIFVNKALQLQILNIQKENLDKQYYTIKRQLRKSPDDIELKDEYSDVKQQRLLIKQRIEKQILENNK